MSEDFLVYKKEDTYSDVPPSSEATQDMRLEEYWSPTDGTPYHKINYEGYTWSVGDFGQQIGLVGGVQKRGIRKIKIGDVEYTPSVSDMVAEFTKKKVGSDLWIDLIWEEAQELFEAYDKGDEYNHDTLKEMADLVYVVHGLANELGWDLDEAIKRVHASNMSKLDDNGEPIYSEAGKRMKSNNYVPPDLSDLVK